MSETLYLYVDAVLVLFEDLKKVLFDVLKHQIQAAFPFKCLLEQDNVGVFEHAEHLDLSHDGLLGDLVFIRLLELLDRN